jgi:hypothetical protein
VINNNMPEQPPITLPVTIEAARAPSVNVAAPAAPDVTVNVEPPNVNVSPAQVHVDGPVVNIPESRSKSKVVTRDANGEITRIDEVDD